MLNKEAYFSLKVLPGLCLRHSTERTYSFPTTGSGQWQELEGLRWQQNKLDLKKNKYDLQKYYFKIGQSLPWHVVLDLALSQFLPKTQRSQKM